VEVHDEILAVSITRRIATADVASLESETAFSPCEESLSGLLGKLLMAGLDLIRRSALL
jgi:hypothetical protein